jgi:hypothetical protein
MQTDFSAIKKRGFRANKTALKTLCMDKKIFIQKLQQRLKFRPHQIGQFSGT